MRKTIDKAIADGQIKEGQFIKDLGFSFVKQGLSGYGHVHSLSGDKVSISSHSLETFNETIVHVSKSGRVYAHHNKKNLFLIGEVEIEVLDKTLVTVADAIKKGILTVTDNLLDWGLSVGSDRLKDTDGEYLQQTCLAEIDRAAAVFIKSTTQVQGMTRNFYLVAYDKNGEALRDSGMNIPQDTLLIVPTMQKIVTEAEGGVKITLRQAICDGLVTSKDSLQSLGIHIKGPDDDGDYYVEGADGYNSAIPSGYDPKNLEVYVPDNEIENVKADTEVQFSDIDLRVRVARTGQTLPDNSLDIDGDTLVTIQDKPVATVDPSPSGLNKVGTLDNGNAIYRDAKGNLVEGDFRDLMFRKLIKAKHTNKTKAFIETMETILKMQDIDAPNLPDDLLHLYDVTFMHYDLIAKDPQ